MVYYLGLVVTAVKYPRNDFLDGDVFEVKLADEVPRENLPVAAHSRSQYLLGHPVKPDHVPTLWQWGPSPAKLPDFYTPGGFPCVSPAMKEMIEGFEPGVHQFFPLKVVNKKKEEIAQRFLWVVCNNLDSVDREHTTFILLKGALWRADYRDGDRRIRIPDAKLYFSDKQVEGHHFWRDTRITGGSLFASDNAGEAMVSAGFTGLGGCWQESV